LPNAVSAAAAAEHTAVPARAADV